MTLETRSDDVRSLKGDAGWRRECSWSSRHGPAPLRFFILNPAMDQGQAVASGRPVSFHEEYGVRRLEPVDAVRSASRPTCTIDSYARKNLAPIMVSESQLVSLSGILPMAWEYEVGSARKHKKKWNHNYHGFVKVGNGWVGKCPHNLTIEKCKEILNNGIEYHSPRSPHEHPGRIYNIIDGVVYRATPTVPGVSYHGFPERPEFMKSLPRNLKEQLLLRAERLECRPEVERWLGS